MTSLPRLFLSCAFGLATTLSHAAGFSFIEVSADNNGPALRGAVWSPCTAPAGRITLDPLVIDGVRDCPISATSLPLVVMSHGKGGSFLGHHDTAAALADAGFVVAAISHPRDNFQDLSPPGTMSVYATRPVDIKRLLDYMLGGWTGRATLDPARVGIFGFSRGGYTALAAIGAVPNFGLREDLCTPNPGIPNCVERLRSDQQVLGFFRRQLVQDSKP
jgi:predicted dienelactone hydrolase